MCNPPTGPKFQCYCWAAHRPRLQRKRASNRTAAFSDTTKPKAYDKQQLAGCTKISTDKNCWWNKGTEKQQGWGKDNFFMGEPMNSPLKYLQTQSGKTTSLAFGVLSCISLQTMIPSKPSVLPVWHTVPWLKGCLLKR